MPGSRRLAALAAAAVLLVALIAFAARGGLGGGSEEEARDAGEAAGSSQSQGDGGSGSGSGSSAAESGNGGDDGATETRNDPPPTAAPGSSGEKATDGQGLPGIGPKGELVPVETAAGPGETLDQQSGKKGSRKPGLSVPAVDTGPLVDRPLPKTASSRGRLVRGYPAKALPVVPGSRVRSSSVSSSERGLQVALVGSVPRRAEAVAAFYRLALAPYGFDEASVPAVGGSTAFGFSRAKDSLVLTITPQGKKSTYSLFGTLSAGSD